ncbi:putative quinol monooxygenase [Flavobacterium branchiarum]|uniref:Quinol monooxygenase n=1 Tax=Flavobacterium branchiarum TaxID=1114870 RepID=A0ABV5FR64_9FLAO|nr:putative quinol monooxygenase [Flavobacterium branchiarum]MDN3672586.1 putative quinol monooxygenase [Flavobacterium branchiarum]
MISITAIIKSKKENNEQVKTMIENLVNQTRKEAACIRYDLHNSDNVYIIWEEWTDQAGLDLHNNQSYLQEFVTSSETYLASQIQVYKTTQIL